MLVATALTRIKRQFGDEYGTLLDDTDIFGWFHEGQLDIIRTTGCNDTTVSNTVASYPLAIPSPIRVKRVSISGIALTPSSIDEIDLLGQSDEATGAVQYWYLQNGQLILWPTGSTPTSTPVNLVYSKVPVEITSSGDSFSIPEVYHEDLVRFCMSRAHNRNRNFDAEKMDIEAYSSNISKRISEAQASDVPLYRGGDPMDFNEFDY